MRAQGNFEIQVYGSGLVPKGQTLVELHPNFTFEGTKQTTDGTLPTNHQFHSTLEVTHGFSTWFETGFYSFASAQPGHGYQWVGAHIRPRFAIPASWRWPVGLSLSNEVGYQRRLFSADTWTWELRPIIDNDWGRWYGAFNPTFGRSFHGESTSKGLEFFPNAKVSCGVTKLVRAGVEYYGGLGSITGFDLLSEQRHLIVPAIDLNLGPDWEFNFGVGVGLTAGTDHLLVKMIVGHRF
jgi:hypothetical protein